MEKSSAAKTKVISAGAALSIEAIKEFEPAALSARSTESSQNALDRVRLKFEAARKQFGRQVYLETVKRQTILQLEKEFNLDFNVDELEDLSDATLTEEAGDSGLRRVA
jgi:hypothetical protein